jgi:hypothetical protein
VSDPDFAVFCARARELGLALAEDDLAELWRGWQGLQPQLERLRRDLTRHDLPMHRPDFTR